MELTQRGAAPHSAPVFPLKNDVPLRAFPSMTLALIATNVFVFVWQLWIGGADSVEVFGAVPRNIVSGLSHDGVPAPLTLLTAMFLHGSWLHLGGNMLFLWIFGGTIEDRVGRLGYLLFYLLCGVLAGLAQVLAAPTSPTPMLGASGAIAGVLGAYFLLFPRSRVLTVMLFAVVHVPAVLFLGLWFLLQLFSLPQGAARGVAIAAHVGGFLSGLVLVRLFDTVRGPHRAT